MRKTGAAAAILCLAALILQIRVHGQNEGQTSWQRYMLNQIVELRTEFSEYLAEGQEIKIRELNRDLEEVRREQSRCRAEEEQRVQQIAQVEQQLSSPELEQPARPQIEAAKNHLMNERAEKLRIDHAALVQREAEITQRLDREGERGRRLGEKVRQLRRALDGQ